jgi:hypothetical protein
VRDLVEAARRWPSFTASSAATISASVAVDCSSGYFTASRNVPIGDVGLLRQEQHARPGRHAHLALAERPDAGERAEQRALARAADARDQGRAARAAG